MARKTRHNYRAMLNEFDMNYGVDETRLDGWKRLCDDCGVNEGPSIRQCKRVRYNINGDCRQQLVITASDFQQNLKRANVNIVDLIYAKRQGRIPHHHQNRQALAVYTLYEGMWFPRTLAKENGFLKVLLVDIL